MSNAVRPAILRTCLLCARRRCASDAEEQSALYNMACAYAAMGQKDSALTCLEVRLSQQLRADCLSC